MPRRHCPTGDRSRWRWWSTPPGPRWTRSTGVCGPTTDADSATPSPPEQQALVDAQTGVPRSLNTTIGVVLTDATLTKAQARKVAAVAHDGLARAIRPVHAMTDGDAIFCLASGDGPVGADPSAALAALNVLLSAAADVFTDACLDALVRATGRGAMPQLRASWPRPQSPGEIFRAGPRRFLDWTTMKALLLENIHPDGVRLLTERGIEVTQVKGALDEAELIEALDGVQLLGIRSKTTVTPAVLEAAQDLVAIGAFCIGTNQIDLAHATEAGVAVFNAPFSNTRSVVELAIAEIIAMARHLTDKNAAMHAGVWDKSAKGAHEVRGRTLGIVGYGNIGSQLSVIAEALGMRVSFYDVADKLALGNARRCNTLEELLASVETVTLHVDGRAGNAGLFGAEQFAQMQPRSLFLNLCRGIVVDHDALRDHLLSGHIAGAALDVFADRAQDHG